MTMLIHHPATTITISCSLYGDRHTYCMTAVIHMILQPPYNMYDGRGNTSISL